MRQERYTWEKSTGINAARRLTATSIVSSLSVKKKVALFKIVEFSEPTTHSFVALFHFFRPKIQSFLLIIFVTLFRIIMSYYTIWHFFVFQKYNISCYPFSWRYYRILYVTFLHAKRDVVSCHYPTDIFISWPNFISVCHVMTYVNVLWHNFLNNFMSLCHIIFCLRSVTNFLCRMSCYVTWRILFWCDVVRNIMSRCVVFYCCLQKCDLISLLYHIVIIICL